MTEPIYDEVIRTFLDSLWRDVVVHRTPDGRTTYYHSPLTDEFVTCKICENGARVYLED